MKSIKLKLEEVKFPPFLARILAYCAALNDMVCNNEDTAEMMCLTVYCPGFKFLIAPISSPHKCSVTQLGRIADDPDSTQSSVMGACALNLGRELMK